MAEKQKDWATLWRRVLTWVLGSKCARCDATEDLQFDCITPCGDRHHKMDTSARMSFYRAQFKAGNLQLLCEDCHAIKTKLDQAQLDLF